MIGRINSSNMELIEESSNNIIRIKEDSPRI